MTATRTGRLLYLAFATTVVGILAAGCQPRTPSGGKPSTPVRPTTSALAGPTLAQPTEPSPAESTTISLRRCTPWLPNERPGENPYETVLEPFDLVAPSGNRIYGYILRPAEELDPGTCLATVILIPGGINPGRTDAYAEDAQLLAGAGMVVLTFNAEGRVDTRDPNDLLSEGTEDYNGYRGQNGLCAVVEYALGLDYVDPNNVGLASHSYGITLAAGCAGRHADIPIKYLVDGEGPPDSFVTCHEPWSLDDNPANDNVELIHEILGRYSTYRDSSAENLAFWSEREAVRLIGSFRGRYLRLQATWDHAQPPSNEAEVESFRLPPLWWQNKHASDMVEAAVQGGVPWVRVNLPSQGNPVNATFSMDNPPTFLPGELADRPWVVLAVLEMARMP